MFIFYINLYCVLHDNGLITRYVYTGVIHPYTV